MSSFFLSTNWESASILVLLRSCSPADVPWLVIAVIIWVAIKLHIFTRAAAHIGNEVAKIFPPVADMNAATAPECPFWIIRIGASLNHSSPYVIFSRCFSSGIFAMLKIPISMMASATADCMASIFPDEVIAQNYLFCSAIAETQPARPSLANLGRSFKNKKSVESLASSVYQGGCHGY